MIRKTILGAVAAVALAAAIAPTAASAKGFHLHIGGPGYGYGYGPYYGGVGYYDYGYWGPDCYLKKVKVWSHKYNKFIWKKKKVCY